MVEEVPPGVVAKAGTRGKVGKKKRRNNLWLELDATALAKGRKRTA
jgi:hypothetical protein